MSQHDDARLRTDVLDELDWNTLVGVRGVDNRNEVAGPDPELIEVRNVIDLARQRRAVHRARTIDEGVVVLRAVVESLEQQRAVHEAVAHAPVIEVVSDERSTG